LTTGLDNETPSSGYGHLSDTGRCYGFWPKWRGIEFKKVEHAMSKITATFCDGHAGRRIQINIARTKKMKQKYTIRGTQRGAAASE